MQGAAERASLTAASAALRAATSGLKQLSVESKVVE